MLVYQRVTVCYWHGNLVRLFSYLKRWISHRNLMTSLGVDHVLSPYTAHLVCTLYTDIPLFSEPHRLPASKINEIQQQFHKGLGCSHASSSNYQIIPSLFPTGWLIHKSAHLIFAGGQMEYSMPSWPLSLKRGICLIADMWMVYSQIFPLGFATMLIYHILVGLD